MTPPALATITGECWGNHGGAFPGAIIFTPVGLVERDGPVDSASRIRAVAHADGSLTLPDGSPVRLWPGLWEVAMPDGQTWQCLVASGQTYTLAYLRGQGPTLVELSGVDAVGLPYGTPPTATLDGGHVTWGIPTGRQPASLVADPAHSGLYLMAVGTDLTPDPANPGLYTIGVSA